MRGVSAAELLSAWEQGFGQPSFRRALILLSAACPELSAEQLARLSIGQRDARLLALRERTFGSELVSVATCSACGEQLEFTFSMADIRVASPAAPASGQPSAPERDGPDPLSLNLNGYEVLFRLPNSTDLAAIADSPEPAASQHLLLQRCVEAATYEGAAINYADLPAAVLDAVAARMEEADPQANVQLNLSCVRCGKSWLAVFDIESFLWSELNRWAERLLLEVHQLARAYGWREADILAMSPQRRRFYLEMLGK
jgi:hypothetical protein